MHDLVVRRAALLQAMLSVLKEQKDCFTDHDEILAFHRLEKEFETVVSNHRDQLTADPLKAIKEDFENDKALINRLRRIDAEARLHKGALHAPQSECLTSEFIQKIIDWLASQKESLEKELSEIQSRLSHEYWDKDSRELLPYAKAIAEVLSEDDLLAPDTKDFVAMASMKGPRYEVLLGTLASIEELLEKKVLYVTHGADRAEHLYCLDDLNKLLGERTVLAFDLAWHRAVGEWKRLFELTTSLRKLDILPTIDAPFVEAMFRRKLFYTSRAGEIRGPFFLDDLNLLLADQSVSRSDLAWHNALADWQPLSELILVLERQKLFHLVDYSKAASPKQIRPNWQAAFILGVILLIFLLGVLFYRDTATHESGPVEATPQFVTLTRPVPVTVAYDGTVQFPAGTRFEFVSEEGSYVRIRYRDLDYAIPISATDLNKP
jgi:hypothetical protein